MFFFALRKSFPPDVSFCAKVFFLIKMLQHLLWTFCNTITSFATILGNIGCHNIDFVRAISENVDFRRFFNGYFGIKHVLSYGSFLRNCRKIILARPNVPGFIVLLISTCPHNFFFALN